MHSDLIIIGAGPGGYETALEAAGRGLRVTLFNGDRLGGTCLNEGCIPTKCMVKDAEVVSTLRHASEYAADNVTFEVDYNRVLSRREAVVTQLRNGIGTLLAKAGVNVVNARASFKDSRTVVADGQEYDADNIIIATGSHSRALPVPGADSEWVLDSAGILNLEFVPASLVVIGGGVIGMEFASVFAALGSEVTVLEYMKQILPPFDSDIAKRLKQSMSKRGVRIETGACVTKLEQNSDYSIKVTYGQKGKECEVTASNVLMAVGRGANVDGLNLEAAGVEYTPKGITVDDCFRTNVDGIYAVGDVNARMMLAHVATAQGKRALSHILGEEDGRNFEAVPSAVFTHPECGMAGLTEEACKERGIECVTTKGFYRANGKALAMGEDEGICKLVFSKEEGRLLGAHVMGAEASLLAQMCCDMIARGMTRAEMKQLIFGHPTLAEVIQSAL